MCQCSESSQARGACATEFQYAVKVVCGEVPRDENQDFPSPVAPGRYWTAINIHNPTKCHDARFRWKVAIANPGRPGPISAYSRTITLRPDEALELDCQQVMQAVQHLAPRFVKGYAVLESDIELDVVAVYTGTPGPCGSNSFHTERVRPRTVPVCEDLVLPIHTGLADWRIIAPTTGSAVVVSPPNGGWGPAPFGSAWVSQAATDGQQGAPVTRSYELCFDLCFGFAVPAPIPIQALADGPAVLYLNGNPIGNVPGWTTPANLFVNPGFLRAGRNCFRIDVPNGGATANPTGFALAGIVRILRGKCPCSPSTVARTTGPAGFALMSDAELPDGQ
ncbi:MAG TPA: hypothetical protein VEQ60_07850 [Longimicrobium sp.]|nr:hypothetical protein [Longimicrobium sp.]